MPASFVRHFERRPPCTWGRALRALQSLKLRVRRGKRLDLLFGRESTILRKADLIWLPSLCVSLLFHISYWRWGGVPSWSTSRKFTTFYFLPHEYDFIPRCRPLLTSSVKSRLTHHYNNPPTNFAKDTLLLVSSFIFK